MILDDMRNYTSGKDFTILENERTKIVIHYSYYYDEANIKMPEIRICRHDKHTSRIILEIVIYLMGGLHIQFIFHVKEKHFRDGLYVNYWSEPVYRAIFNNNHYKYSPGG